MPKPQNVILIMTDNQQAETLGCYGNPEIVTPNLDRLAETGFTFEKAYCPNAFCSPCRASTLTGLMPSQHGVHAWIDDRNMSEWPAGWHALNGLSTLPELMQSAGYRTGLFGKYHLGEPTTSAPGFESWVTMEDGHVRSFYNNRIFDNGQSYMQSGHSVDFFTDKAIEFIEGCSESEQPFFAYLPYPAPYGHWPATNEPIRHRFSALYDDCPINTIPRVGLRPEAVAAYDLVKARSGGGLDFSMLLRAPNDLPTLRNYYSQITLIDDAVGNLVKRLQALGLEQDTLLIFTADHGLSMGHHGFWGHGAACWPSNLHQAAHSIPLLVSQPGTVESGTRSRLHVSNTDLFATILDYIGLQAPNAPETPLPSRSLTPLLKGEPLVDWGEDEVFSEQEETRVIRTPQWAYFKRFRGETQYELGDELYDVENDPGETNNLINDPEHAEVGASLAARIDAFFAANTNPQADLWNGGRPLQNSKPRWLWKDAWGEDWAPVYRYSHSE